LVTAAFTVLLSEVCCVLKIKKVAMATINMNPFKTKFQKIVTLLYMSAALLVIGNTKAQNVGIGVASPLAKLHVGGGNVLVDQNLQVNGSSLFLQKFTVGLVLGETDHKLLVAGGKTWTSTLMAGGERYTCKMFSVYRPPVA